MALLCQTAEREPNCWEVNFLMNGEADCSTRIQGSKPGRTPGMERIMPTKCFKRSACLANITARHRRQKIE